MINYSRFWGLVSGSLSGYIWWYFPYIVAQYGFYPTAFVGIGSALNAMLAFYTQPHVKSIKVLADGQLQLEVSESVLTSRKITCHRNAFKKLNALPDSEASEQEGDIAVVVLEHTDASGRIQQEQLLLKLPGDSVRDSNYLDFLLEEKDEDSATNEDYFDLLEKRAERIRNLPAPDTQKRLLKGSTYGAAESDNNIADLIEKNSEEVDAKLRQMQDHYGKEKLDSLSPKELFQLFKHHQAGAKI